MYRGGTSAGKRWLRRVNMAWILGIGLVVSAAATTPVRIKDMAKVQMGQEVQLTGVGLVDGLDGSGDGRQAAFTMRMLANMMHRMKIAVDPNQIRVRNVAGVSVTAILSPYARKGSRIDVHIASLGDASSLQGGTLMMTALMGPDGKTYVSAQGPVSIGGFNLGGAGGGVRKNHTVVGNVPNGGLVVEEMEQLIQLDRDVKLLLYEADWTTATRTAWAIDQFLGEEGRAIALDAGTISVGADLEFDNPQKLAELVADIEKVQVVPDVKARVVVNERTGTVIIGENVSVSAVALSHGSLRLKIPSDNPDDAFGGGNEVVEEPDRLHPIINSFDVGAMPTVRELVRNLNALGVTPRDLISILQGVKAAGALRAELVIQ